MANTAREEGGWQAHEKSMLLYEIERAEAEGRPVKSVFQKVPVSVIKKLVLRAIVKNVIK